MIIGDDEYQTEITLPSLREVGSGTAGIRSDRHSCGRIGQEPIPGTGTSNRPGGCSLVERASADASSIAVGRDPRTRRRWEGRLWAFERRAMPSVCVKREDNHAIQAQGSTLVHL